MKKYALLGLAMIIVTSAAFFAGLQWQKHRVRSQLTDALGTQLVCTASGLLSDVTVATLLDKNDGRDAQDTLLVDIKSAIAKLKAFEPYLNRNDQAKVTDALRNGETYLSTKPLH